MSASREGEAGGGVESKINQYSALTHGAFKGRNNLSSPGWCGRLEPPPTAELLGRSAAPNLVFEIGAMVAIKNMKHDL